VQHTTVERIPGIEWWQVHIRGYCHARDGPRNTCSQLELTAHFEPEPVEYPDAHLSGNFIDVARGNRVLVDVLEENDVPYRKVGDWS
jgi:hypothetical protein